MGTGDDSRPVATCVRPVLGEEPRGERAGERRRVGVLCYSWLYSYQVDALRRLLASTGSTVSLVVIDESTTGRTPGTAGGITGLVDGFLDHFRQRQ